MKSIELHTAVVDNGGTRREAGDQITVGSKAGQIELDRAKDMVARGSAVTLRAAPAPKKAAAKKPVAKAKPAAKPAAPTGALASSSAAEADKSGQ